jgi:formylglycine-generating enzyme required for sulfatase activity
MMETGIINKKCPKCGQISPSSYKFCPECGQIFIKGNINPDTQPISRFPVITLTLLIVLFLALGGLGIWYMFIYPPPAFLQNVVGLVMPSQTPTIPTPTVTLTATEIPPTPTATNTPEPTATITLTPTLPPFPPVEAKAKETWVSPVDGMTLVYVPKDLYLIGSLDTDTQAWINEKPQHPVNLSGFWMDKTEVTNAMYAKCVLAGVCPEKKKVMSYTRESYYGNVEFDEYPVIFVSWNDAQTYCAWAGRKLPTEAQWEAAARGPDGKKYPWGNANPNCNLLNFATRIDMKGGKSSLCTGDTTAVGKYPKGASPFGLLDMAGNVWEWVADWNSPNYVVEPRQDPTGPADGESRVIRGGYFFADSKYVRAAMRSWHEPGFTSNDLGFRCAR